jgi:hypothetical protein
MTTESADRIFKLITRRSPPSAAAISKYNDIAISHHFTSTQLLPNHADQEILTARIGPHILLMRPKKTRSNGTTSQHEILSDNFICHYIGTICTGKCLRSRFAKVYQKKNAPAKIFRHRTLRFIFGSPKLPIF